MEVTLHSKMAVKVEMEVTVKEFAWLKDLLKDKLYEDETPSERMMRVKWFESLQSAWDNHIPF